MQLLKEVHKILVKNTAGHTVPKNFSILYFKVTLQITSSTEIDFFKHFMHLYVELLPYLKEMCNSVFQQAPQVQRFQ